MRKTFYFVAGEQVMTMQSVSVLDAWLAIEVKAKTQPIASEFRRLPITAMDATGKELATRSWGGWHDAVMQDTYGSDWQETVERCSRLV